MAVFVQLALAQRGRYAAYVNTGRHVVCSASPELFFQKADGVLTSRPMKGTRPRGRTYGGRGAARVAFASEKDRAENVMIVDMSATIWGASRGGQGMCRSSSRWSATRRFCR